MRVGRRALRFWIYLFLASGTGCAGCGNCFDIGPVGGCDFSDIGCEGGFCFGSPEDGGPPYCSYGDCDAGAFGGQAIRVGLRAPQGVVSDGVEVFFVDDGSLYRIDIDGDEPEVLAVGVDASGGLATNGVDVFWSGGWSGESVDGGSLDAGDGGDGGEPAIDAGDDAGDDAGIAIAKTPGIYAVPAIGGDVRIIGALPVLATLAIDDTNAYARTPTDDAGSATLGAYDLSGDSGVVTIGTLVGNTGNLHAFVPRAADVVALNQNDIVSLPFDGGATSLIASDAGALGLYATTSGVVSVSAGDLFSDIGFVGADAQPTAVAPVGMATSFGNFLYFVEPKASAIYRIDITNPADVKTIVALSGPVLYLAADANDVYWMTPGPSGALFAASAR